MLDLQASDPRLLDDIEVVVGEICHRVDVDPDRIMLVGAACRDILHSALGHDVLLRSTDDTDIGLALTDWSLFERIDSSYARLGDTGVRYLIGGMKVDVMPFGDVENPAGIVSPASRRAPMVVFGFDDVYEHALPLQLAAGLCIRLPTPAGYAALKMRAWIDRWSYLQDKDGKDLATAIYWYLESGAVADLMWNTSDGNRILDEVGWDQERAASRILGRDIRRQDRKSVV